MGISILMNAFVVVWCNMKNMHNHFWESDLLVNLIFIFYRYSIQCKNSAKRRKRKKRKLIFSSIDVLSIHREKYYLSAVGLVFLLFPSTLIFVFFVLNTLNWNHLSEFYEVKKLFRNRFMDIISWIIKRQLVSFKGIIPDT